MAISPATAKVTHLLPKPQKVTVTEGTFALGRAVQLTDPTQCKYLQRVLEENGCTISEGATATVNVKIVESIEGAHDYKLAGYDNEAYTIDITANSIEITAIEPIGVIRAAQTIAQLAEGWEGEKALELVSLKDWPAFKLRGYMHDVGRSFITIEEIKKHIDLLARFKVNTFHWHMTENQAWRFEVKKYPELTSSSSMTRFPGKFYTQEQCREVEQYAAERGVIVIPEIDMPGHSEAFKRAMGHDMQTAQGVEELQYILEEVAAVFTLAPYIHIGADEKGITYPNFLKIMTDKIHSLDKLAVCWNPISGVTITKSTGFDMTQMWSTAGKKIAGLPNIDCRYNYTNHFDVFADLVGIYKSNIYYAQQGSAEVAGTISAPWNDRITPTQEDIIKQNNFYANVIASAERAWIGGGKQYIEVGGTTLPNSGEEYEEFADWERRFLFHKANSLKNEPIPYVKQTNVRWRITDAFPNNGNMAASFPPETETGEMKESYTYNGVTYGSGMATGAGIYLRHTWPTVVPSYYSNSQLNTTAYAWTYVYSEKAQTVGAQIEFQNYGRSEKDTAPDKGKWDRKGSRIWLNGTEILPPTWDNSGVGINNEVYLKNENFTARKPIQVELKAGWNKVFLKLPYVNASGVRLNKWMFTFVLTDLEGKNAVDGLIYSPNKCIDEAAEQVAATISEIQKEILASVGEGPGFYSTTYANDINAIIAEIEATLQKSEGAEVRKEQIARLNSALEAFKESLKSATINQPKVSSGTTEVYYSMHTPLRENRYATSKGAAADMIGEKSPSAASYWKFVKRADGDLDIVNYADGTFISPNSSNNTALKTATTSPSKGWTIKAANETGYVIIVSGNVQFNQTNNSSLGYKVYNWGSGTNTDDTGCKYMITEEPELPAKPGETTGPKPFAVVAGLEKESYPYKLSEANEALIFGKENLTIAFDLTSSSTTTNNEAFFAASDPTVACQETNVAATSFTSIGAFNSQIRFYISAKSGQWHTRGNSGAIAKSSDHKVVIVFTKDGNSKCYVDGTAYDSGLAQNLYQYKNNSNANFYVGGGVTNAGELYPFLGKIRSVQFFDKAMSADEIATIDYNISVEGHKLTVVSNEPLANASFSWNGETVSAGSSINLTTGSTITEATLAVASKASAYKFAGFYSDAAYSNFLGTEVEIASLTADKTIYAKFELDIFSEKFGEKELRIKMVRDNSYTARYFAEATDGANGGTRVSDLSIEEELWYLVGNADAVKIYSKSAGESVALNVASASEGAAATMKDAAKATTWKLVKKSKGYALVPSNGTNMSINSYGGKGCPLKLYNANDEGGWWLFDIIDETPLSFTIEIAGERYENTNQRVANLSFTINGTATNSLIKEAAAEKRYYLPVGATFSLSNSFIYRGYTFEGFLNEEGEPTEYKDAPLTPGLKITAKYNVDAANKYQYLYYSNDEKMNKPYRIPAIATAPNGHIFGISDHRPCGSDIGYGEVDVKCRISKDNGATWSEEFFVANGIGDNNGGQVWKTGFGDAAIVADCERNELLVMMVCGKTVCWNGNYTTNPNSTNYNPNRVAQVRAKYNEETQEWEWTEPKEVTETIYPLFVKNGKVTVQSLFIGSGRICQSRVVKKGDYYRLYCAVWTKNEGNRVIYSDDFGDTWNIVGTVDSRPGRGGDEPKCEELPDGTVVLSSRRGGGRVFNLFKYSDDTFTKGSWGTEVSSNSVNNGLSFGGNSTNGEILLVDVKNEAGEDKKIFLQSIPTGSSRTDVAIYYKEIDESKKYTPTTISQGWRKGIHVSTIGSAYSTMTVQKNGNIGFLFEEEPNGYCIVYGNLTIEDVTGGKYSASEKTGIDNITVTVDSSNGAIYDLSGRKVNYPSKGIYIVDGKKMLIK